MAASPACQHGALWTSTTHTWTHQHLLTQTEFHSTVMPLHTLAQTHTFVALGRFRGRTSASTINWNILLVREVERLVSFFCPENKYFRCWTNSMSAWDGLYSSVCVSVCVCVCVCVCERWHVDVHMLPVHHSTWRLQEERASVAILLLAVLLCWLIVHTTKCPIFLTQMANVTSSDYFVMSSQ